MRISKAIVRAYQLAGIAAIYTLSELSYYFGFEASVVLNSLVAKATSWREATILANCLGRTVLYTAHTATTGRAFAGNVCRQFQCGYNLSQKAKRTEMRDYEKPITPYLSYPGLYSPIAFHQRSRVHKNTRRKGSFDSLL